MSAETFPAPPSHLDETAAAEWRRLVERITQLGRIADLDPAELEVRCQALSRHRRATAAIGNEFSYRHKDLLKPKPEVAVIQDAERTIRAFDDKWRRGAKREG